MVSLALRTGHFRLRHDLLTGCYPTERSAYDSRLAFSTDTAASLLWT
ncbi:hypothetical protein FHX11_002407 [Rhizobium sp. BK602]|nr:hypothetical protein [Rhizobium sp. BK602]